MYIEKCDVRKDLMVFVTINGLPGGVEGSQIATYVDGEPQGTPTVLANDLIFQAKADKRGRLYLEIDLGADGVEKLSTDYIPPVPEDEPKVPEPQVKSMNPTVVDVRGQVALRGDNLGRVNGVRLGQFAQDQAQNVLATKMRVSFKITDTTMPGTYEVFIKTPDHGWVTTKQRLTVTGKVIQ